MHYLWFITFSHFLKEVSPLHYLLQTSSQCNSKVKLFVLTTQECKWTNIMGVAQWGSGSFSRCFCNSPLMLVAVTFESHMVVTITHNNNLCGCKSLPTCRALQCSHILLWHIESLFEILWKSVLSSNAIFFHMWYFLVWSFMKRFQMLLLWQMCLM